eukprot:TRINITY_DN5599_c0_g5_i1.p1 TRINITY_DN5599_c0_g5~~TRINITY_DN5599_c0_g5_i1.p1  ORF type:complete len:421 (+),score=46.15 TRINITY_DN5599_c0_g5_i1:503-1765(+)
MPTPLAYAATCAVTSLRSKHILTFDDARGCLTSTRRGLCETTTVKVLSYEELDLDTQLWWEYEKLSRSSGKGSSTTWLEASCHVRLGEGDSAVIATIRGDITEMRPCFLMRCLCMYEKARGFLAARKAAYDPTFADPLPSLKDELDVERVAATWPNLSRGDNHRSALEEEVGRYVPQPQGETPGCTAVAPGEYRFEGTLGKPCIAGLVIATLVCLLFLAAAGGGWYLYLVHFAEWPGWALPPYAFFFVCVSTSVAFVFAKLAIQATVQLKATFRDSQYAVGRGLWKQYIPYSSITSADVVMSAAQGEKGGVTYTYKLVDFATGRCAPLTKLHRPASLAMQRRVRLGGRAHRDALDTLAGLRAFIQARRAACGLAAGDGGGGDVVPCLSPGGEGGDAVPPPLRLEQAYEKPVKSPIFRQGQ